MRNFTFLLLFLIPSLAFALQEPIMTKSKKSVEIKLGKDIENKLAQYHSFQAFTQERFPKEIQHIFKSRKDQTPMVNLLDLNKDKKQDAVIMGTIRLKGKAFIEVVALVSSGDKYVLNPIKRWKIPNLGVKDKNGQVEGQWPYYILTANDHEHQFNKVPAKATAFKVEAYQSSSLLYYWDGKKFKFIRH